MVYHLNQFVASSDCALPCLEDIRSYQYTFESPLLIKFEELGSKAFDFYQIVGVRANRLIKTYETNHGILLSTDDYCQILIDAQQDIISYDDSRSSRFGESLAKNLLVNLALAIRSLMRGDLPIHCCSVAIEDKMVGIAAVSGMGKSTLLWELICTGSKFVADDVLTMCFRNRRMLATPSRSIPAKISLVAADRFGMSIEGKEECIPNTNEYWIPIPVENRLMDEQPLKALIILAPDPPGAAKREKPNIISIKKQDAICCLIIRYSQGLWAIAPMLDPSLYMKACRAIARQTQVFVVQYERTFDALPMLADAIRNLAKRL